MSRPAESAVGPELHPEVRELLVEVSRRGESLLFQVPARRWSRELLEPAGPVRPSAAFLSSAERHLLEAYRAEAAWFLRATALRLLADDEHARRACTWYWNGNRRLEIPGDTRLAESQARLLEPTLARDADRDLVRTLVTAGRRKLSVSDCAAAAQRLEPHPAVHAYTLSYHFAQGDASYCRSLSSRLMDGNPESPVQRQGLEWAGSYAAAWGQWEKASDFYSEALAHPSAGLATALLAWLNSLQCGRIELAAEILGPGGPSAEDINEALTVLENALTVARRWYSWKPSAALTAARSSCEASYPPVLLEALFQ